MVGLLCVTAFDSSLAAGPSGTKRRLIHSFAKPGFADIWVTLVEYPSPKAAVKTVGLDLKQAQYFVPISQERFDRIWKTFQSSGVDKYVKDPTRPDSGYRSGLAMIAGPNDYFFMVGPRSYAVPKDRASAALISVVKELRNFVK